MQNFSTQALKLIEEFEVTDYIFPSCSLIPLSHRCVCVAKIYHSKISKLIHLLWLWRRTWCSLDSVANSNQHVYKSHAIEIYLCQWSLEIIINLSEDSLLIFFEIWGWKIDGMARDWTHKSGAYYLSATASSTCCNNWDGPWTGPTQANFWPAVNQRPTHLWPRYFLTWPEEIFFYPEGKKRKVLDLLGKFSKPRGSWPDRSQTG